MHPDTAFRPADRAEADALIDDIAFAAIFAMTSHGPRVAHAPLLRVGADTFRFHLARGNALTRHLDGAVVLAVLQGPDAYISARWYAEAAQVPTWNYVVVEIEGTMKRLDDAALPGLIDSLSNAHEARVSRGTPWTMAKVPEAKLTPMLGAIVAFELHASDIRTTIKLSQNKSAEERERVAAGLDAEGASAMAALVREGAGS